MGCIASKDGSTLSPNSKRATPGSLLLQGDKQFAVKFRILDAIKRRDPILFEKTIQEYDVKSIEIFGSSSQQKTVLHHIAEHNFVEGMTLTLEYIMQYHSDDAPKALNSKDSSGNTPLITCCLYNSVESLEVLMKYEQNLDQSIKNLMGKTALEIAVERESPCLNLLQPGALSQSRATTGGANGSTYLNHGVGATALTIPKAVPNKDDDALSGKSSRRGSLILKSVTSMTKDKTTLNPNTKLYHLLKQLEETNGNFVDDDFPHDVFSMVNQGSVQDLTEKHDILKWGRPAQFLRQAELANAKVFEAIELNDVSASPIAGCDLYSALAAMTEFPQRLLKIFTTKETNKQGAYSVSFLISGIPVEILLDDYFPCTTGNYELLYSRPPSSELWFLLLEKAFAKLYGNYTEIQSVYVSEAFEMMTGMPSTQQPLRDAKAEDLWAALVDYDKKNYIVCAGTYQKLSNANRIFTIVGVYEAENLKILKLRNPFEDLSWEGDYANGSEKWTKQLREELGHYQGEKNSFYVEINEFIQNFDFMSICHYHDSWVRNNLEVTAEYGKSVFFELTLEKEMDVFLSVHQKLPRFIGDAENYDISPVEIILAEYVNDNEMKAIAFGEKDSLVGKHTVYATEKAKLRLPEGKYIMRVKIRWVDMETHEFTLNTFSPHPIGLKQVKKEAYPSFVEKVYLNIADLHGEKFELSNGCQFSSGWSGSHMWLYAINNGQKNWSLDVNFEKMTNLKLDKKYKIEENAVGFRLKPGEKAVAYVKRMDGGAVELSWKFKQSWE